jgi:hypothetical protein
MYLYFFNARGLKGKIQPLQQFIHHGPPAQCSQIPTILLVADAQVSPGCVPHLTGYPPLEPARGTIDAKRGVHAFVAEAWSHVTSPSKPPKYCSSPDIQWTLISTPLHPRDIAIAVFYAPGSYYTDEENAAFYLCLSDAIAHYGKTHEIIIMGDANAHVPSVTGVDHPRLDANGTRLTAIGTEHNLSFLNGSPICTGKYTYFDGNVRTAIDYVMATPYACSLITDMSISNDTIGSDHYLISIRIAVGNTAAPQLRPKIREHPIWHPISEDIWKHIRATYLRKWDECCSGNPPTGARGMELWEQTVLGSIDAHATRRGSIVHTPTTRPDKNTTLLTGLATSRAAHNCLDNSPTTSKYMTATQSDINIRSCASTVLASDRAATMSDLTKLYFRDNTLFWKTIAGITKTSRRRLPAAMFNNTGQPITSKRNRRALWHERFHTMSRPTQSELHSFDQSHKQMVDGWISDRAENSATSAFEDTISGANNTLSIALVWRVIAMLNDTNPGPEGFTKSFLVNILKVAAVDFTRLLQSVWDEHDPPLSWKTTHTLPMHKKGSIHTAPNYRPVCPEPTLAKLYDKIMEIKMTDAINRSQSLDTEQGGFRKGRGTAGQIYVTLAVSQRRLALHLATIIAFLDLRSAFDRVWRAAAFMLLHEGGVTGLLWDNIVAYYKDRRNKAYLDDCFSDWITHEDGVIQGAVTSPLIFIVFINPLIRALKDAGIGVIIDNKISPGVLFADDIAIIAKTVEEMRKALDIVSKWANKWRMAFSPSKCKIIIIGKEHAPDIDTSLFMLQGRSLSVSTAEKYLGVIISDTGTVNLKHVQARIRSAMGAVRAMTDSGVRAWGMAPEAIASLNLILIEKLLGYGLCFVQDFPSTVGKTGSLQVAQGKIAKFILGVGQKTSTTAALAILGWLPIRYLIAIERVRLYMRILAGGEGPQATALLLEEEKRTAIGTSGGPEFTCLLQRDCDWLGLGDHTILKSGNKKSIMRWFSHACEEHAAEQWQTWSGTTAPLVRAACADRAMAQTLLSTGDMAHTRTALLLELPASPSWPITCNVCSQLLTSGTSAQHVMASCIPLTTMVRPIQEQIMIGFPPDTIITDLTWALFLATQMPDTMVTNVTNSPHATPKQAVSLFSNLLRALDA